MFRLFGGKSPGHGRKSLTRKYKFEHALIKLLETCVFLHTGCPVGIVGLEERSVSSREEKTIASE